MPQLLRALVPVGAQPLVLVRQNLHESVPGIRQVQQVLNRSFRANFVIVKRKNRVQIYQYMIKSELYLTR